MSGKLDQSLDEIVSSHRGGSARGRAGRRGGRPTRAAARPAAPGHIGGINKAVKTKGVRVPTGPSGGDSKIFVSNLVRHLHPINAEFILTSTAQGCEREPDQGMLPVRSPSLWTFETFHTHRIHDPST